MECLLLGLAPLRSGIAWLFALLGARIRRASYIVVFYGGTSEHSYALDLHVAERSMNTRSNLHNNLRRFMHGYVIRASPRAKNLDCGLLTKATLRRHLRHI